MLVGDEISRLDALFSETMTRGTYFGKSLERFVERLIALVTRLI